MTNIEIVLEISGEKKTFTCTKVKGILLRKTASIIKTFNKLGENMDESTLDEIVDYVVDVFDGKFARDEFYDGIDLDELIPTVQNIAATIMEKAAAKLKN